MKFQLTTISAREQVQLMLAREQMHAENVLWLEEIKARGLWGCFSRDFPWHSDPAHLAEGDPNRSDDTDCVRMLLRVFSDGFCERLSLDVVEVARKVLLRENVAVLLEQHLLTTNFPRAVVPHATVRYPGGMVYTGEWWCGQWSGRGTVTYSSGATYTGQFKGTCSRSPRMHSFKRVKKKPFVFW